MRESLETLQRRFFAAITGRNVVSDGLSPRLTRAWIHGRTPAEAVRRLETYAEMHRVRLHDVLRDDYLRVHAALGDEPFAKLAFDYVDRHPSRSSTLHELGHAFAGFLADQPLGRERPELPELARLDAARNQVFDAADDVELTPTDLASWDVNAWQERRVRRVRASALLRCELGIAEVWRAYDTLTPPPSVERMPQALLVWRRELVVRHREVAAAEERLLELLEEPMSMATVCEHLARCGDAEHSSAEHAFQRLHQWLVDGLLTLA